MCGDNEFYGVGLFLMLRMGPCLTLLGVSFYLCTVEESHIDERSKELKSKDEIMSQKEKIIQEKSNSVAQLQNEIVSLQVSHLDSHYIVSSFILRKRKDACFPL